MNLKEVYKSNLFKTLLDGEAILRQLYPSIESIQHRERVYKIVTTIIKWVIEVDHTPTLKDEDFRARKEYNEANPSARPYKDEFRIFQIGSGPLRVFLPGGDIDVGIAIAPSFLNEFFLDFHAVLDHFPKFFASDAKLKAELSPYLSDEESLTCISDSKLIDANRGVKVIKCIVLGVPIDITANTLTGLAAVCFFEHIDRVIGRDHLFKKSVLLLKAWLTCDAMIVASNHFLLSSYAVEVMTLFIINHYYADLSFTYTQSSKASLAERETLRTGRNHKIPNGDQNQKELDSELKSLTSKDVSSTQITPPTQSGLSSYGKDLVSWSILQQTMPRKGVTICKPYRRFAASKLLSIPSFQERDDQEGVNNTSDTKLTKIHPTTKNTFTQSSVSNKSSKAEQKDDIAFQLEELTKYPFDINNLPDITPFSVMYRFCEVFSQFDFESYVVSLTGPIPIQFFREPSNRLTFQQASTNSLFPPPMNSGKKVENVVTVAADCSTDDVTATLSTIESESESNDQAKNNEKSQSVVECKNKTSGDDDGCIDVEVQADADAEATIDAEAKQMTIVNQEAYHTAKTNSQNVNIHWVPVPYPTGAYIPLLEKSNTTTSSIPSEFQNTPLYNLPLDIAEKVGCDTKYAEDITRVSVQPANLFEFFDENGHDHDNRKTDCSEQLNQSLEQSTLNETFDDPIEFKMMVEMSDDNVLPLETGSISHKSPSLYLPEENENSSKPLIPLRTLQNLVMFHTTGFHKDQSNISTVHSTPSQDPSSESIDDIAYNPMTTCNRVPHVLLPCTSQVSDKHMTILDPLDYANNIGTTVNASNQRRIAHCLKDGWKMMNSIIGCAIFASHLALLPSGDGDGEGDGDGDMEENKLNLEGLQHQQHHDDATTTFAQRPSPVQGLYQWNDSPTTSREITCLAMAASELNAHIQKDPMLFGSGDVSHLSTSNFPIEPKAWLVSDPQKVKTAQQMTELIPSSVHFPGRKLKILHYSQRSRAAYYAFFEKTVIRFSDSELIDSALNIVNSHRQANSLVRRAINGAISRLKLQQISESETQTQHTSNLNLNGGSILPSVGFGSHTVEIHGGEVVQYDGSSSSVSTTSTPDVGSSPVSAAASPPLPTRNSGLHQENILKGDQQCDDSQADRTENTRSDVDFDETHAISFGDSNTFSNGQFPCFSEGEAVTFQSNSNSNVSHVPQTHQSMSMSITSHPVPLQPSHQRSLSNAVDDRASSLKYTTNSPKLSSNPASPPFQPTDEDPSSIPSSMTGLNRPMMTIVNSSESFGHSLGSMTSTLANSYQEDSAGNHLTSQASQTSQNSHGCATPPQNSPFLSQNSGLLFDSRISKALNANLQSSLFSSSNTGQNDAPRTLYAGPGGALTNLPYQKYYDGPLPDKRAFYSAVEAVCVNIDSVITCSIADTAIFVASNCLGNSALRQISSLGSANIMKYPSSETGGTGNSYSSFQDMGSEISAQTINGKMNSCTSSVYGGLSSINHPSHGNSSSTGYFSSSYDQSSVSGMSTRNQHQHGLVEDQKFTTMGELGSSQSRDPPLSTLDRRFTEIFESGLFWKRGVTIDILKKPTTTHCWNSDSHGAIPIEVMLAELSDIRTFLTAVYAKNLPKPQTAYFRKSPTFSSATNPHSGGGGVNHQPVSHSGQSNNNTNGPNATNNHSSNSNVQNHDPVSNHNIPNPSTNNGTRKQHTNTNHIVPTNSNVNSGNTNSNMTNNSSGKKNATKAKNSRVSNKR